MSDTATTEAPPASAPPRPTPAPAAPAPKRRGPLFKLIMIAILAGVAWWLFGFINHGLHYEVTDDAYLTGHLPLVSSRLAGNVVEVLVTDNEAVQAGQVLARLDPAQFQIAKQKADAAVAQARAQERQAQAKVDSAKADALQMDAQVAQAEAQVQQMSAELDMANTNFGRNERIQQSDVRAVSKAELDNTKNTAQASRAAVTAAQANLQAAEAHAGAATAELESAQAEVIAAQAAIAAQEAAAKDAERDLSYVEIKSPVAGRIGNKNVEPGNRVQVGQALFAIVGQEAWIVANFKETQLRHMQVGQPVEITIDAVSGRDFTGKLDSFAPATGAQFALLPPDNATGNFTKVVQRVPVKIVFDPESIKGVENRLHPGLSTVVNVRIK